MWVFINSNPLIPLPAISSSPFFFLLHNPVPPPSTSHLLITPANLLEVRAQAAKYPQHSHSPPQLPFTFFFKGCQIWASVGWRGRWRVSQMDREGACDQGQLTSNSNKNTIFLFDRRATTNIWRWGRRVKWGATESLLGCQIKSGQGKYRWV